MGVGDRRILWLMAAPFLVGVTALILAPAFGSLAMAFYEWDLVRPPRFVGSANLRELIGDPVFRITLRNSLLYVAAAVPLRLVGALGIALVLHGRGRVKAAGRVSVLIPTVIPDAAYALVWLWILNPLYGPLNLALGAAGLPDARLVLAGDAGQMGRRDHGGVPTRRGCPDRVDRTGLRARGAPRDRRDQRSRTAGAGSFG